MIKMFQMFAIGVLIFIGSAGKVCAADSVGLSAMVVERKSYNTINDFDFSNMGQSTIAIDQEGKVEGASTEVANQSVLNTILIISILALSGYLIGLFFLTIRKMKMRESY